MWILSVARRVICFCFNRPAIWWFNLYLLVAGILIFSLEGRIKFTISFWATVWVTKIYWVSQAQHLKRLLIPCFSVSSHPPNLPSISMTVTDWIPCDFQEGNGLPLSLCALSLYLLLFLLAWLFHVVFFPLLHILSLLWNKLTEGGEALSPFHMIFNWLSNKSLNYNMSS